MGFWWIPFAVILMVGESNAVNLTDGLDGLAIGLVMLVFITLSILTYLSGMISKPIIVLTSFMKKAGSTGNLELSASDVEVIGKYSRIEDWTQPD